MISYHEPIDAVVTWVDGDDSAHKSLRELHMRTRRIRSMKYIPSGQGDRRYKNNNEIEFCLHSIRKYLPWIRNIYLVTDKQTPDFLSDEIKNELNVEIIDHSVIFRGFEWALPTFNSITIESMLYRIPGISGKYIYFNDDFIPVAPSDVSDFFDRGKVVLRGKWKSQKIYAGSSILLAAFALRFLAAFTKKDRSAHLLAQMKAARLAGFRKDYIHCPHAPHPVRTETLREFFRENPEILEANIKYKFRNMSQFVSHPLAHHLEVAAGNHVLSEVEDYVTINFEKPDEVESAIAAMDDPRVKFVCVQALELASDLDRRRIHAFLSDRTKDRSLHGKRDGARG